MSNLTECGLPGIRQIPYGLHMCQFYSSQIRDGADTYGKPGAMRGKALAGLWLEEEQRALRDGYRGLRLTGNITALGAADWPPFMAYEEAVNESFAGRRIVALCTYLLADCAGERQQEVMQRHACVLDRPDEGWQLTTSR